MRVSYEELTSRIGALQPDLDAANLAERAVGHVLGPSSRRIVGQVATHARGGGFGRASAVDLACEIASIEALDPDLRRAILIDVADDGEVGVNYASPSVCGDIEAMAMVACTPSAFVGMCLSSSATVCLLRAMSDRAGARCPWSPEWFRREAFRLASLGGRCDDGDIARNALSARFDTVWSGLAAECLYGMFRERKVEIGTDLWVRAADDAKLNGYWPSRGY